MWRSKSQTEIVSSTLHAENVDVSNGMCDLLPMSDVFNKLCEYLKVERSEESRVIRAFEDNEGALKLANATLW